MAKKQRKAKPYLLPLRLRSSWVAVGSLEVKPNHAEVVEKLWHELASEIEAYIRVQVDSFARRHCDSN